MNEDLLQWFKENNIETDNLNVRYDNNDTALHLACRKGNAQAARWLLEAGAETEAKNFDGNPPLWHACFAGSSEIVKMLAKANANLDHTNDNRTTSLMYCASSGREELVKLLLKLGANKEIENLDGFRALEHASTRAILQMLR